MISNLWKSKLNLIQLLLLSIAVAGLIGCTPAQTGALLGGGIGAGTGAIIGSEVCHSGAGALIGAGIGALSGALIGDAIDEANGRPRYYGGHYDRGPYYDDDDYDYPPPRREIH